MVVHTSGHPSGTVWEIFLFSSFWDSFEVGNTILSLVTWAVASMGQGGKLPLPQISVLPQIGSAPITIVSWLKQLPLKITIMPISLTNHIMQISQFVQQQNYLIKLEYSTIVDLFYCKIYLLTGAQRPGWEHVPLCPPKALGGWEHYGHRNRRPDKCFYT